MHDRLDHIHKSLFAGNVFDALPCGLMVVDQSGRVTAVNNVSKSLYGVDAESADSGDMGQMLNCLHQSLNETECGLAESCDHCDVRSMALSSISKNEIQNSRLKFQVVIDRQVRDIHLKLSATPYRYKGKKYSFLVIEKKSATDFVASPPVKNTYRGIIGRTAEMQDLFRTIQQIGPTEEPVLIQGESGTGKELVALAIHHESHRAARHFVPVNCGALPQGLLESELFGHVKGSFTGAEYNKKGRFRIADGGTIFLDEIGELTPEMQAKFLRVLENGEYEPVGSDKTIRVNVRVVSATNRILENEIEKGRFRRDLYHRLCVMPVFLPPLRTRKEDIPLLANHFINLISAHSQEGNIRLSTDAMALLKTHEWPGNVRELQNTLKFAVIKCQKGVIEPNHLPFSLLTKQAKPMKRRRRKLKLNEAQVSRALQQTGGNKRWAAEILGVSRSTLYRFLE